MFRKKAQAKAPAVDPELIKQFQAFQAAIKPTTEKPKPKPGKQQAKPAPKRKKRSRLGRFVLFLVSAFVIGLAIAFHYFPLVFIELFEAI